MFLGFFPCRFGGRRASPPNLQEKRPGKEVRGGGGGKWGKGDVNRRERLFIGS